MDDEWGSTAYNIGNDFSYDRAEKGKEVESEPDAKGAEVRPNGKEAIAEPDGEEMGKEAPQSPDVVIEEASNKDVEMEEE